MKKILSNVILMMAVINAQAQLSVNTGGNVEIGTNATNYAKLNISASRTNIRAIRTGTATGAAPVIESTCSISSPQWAIGVKGFGSGTNGAFNCGLWGAASNSTSNNIYGVFGSIDTPKGAAIYGHAYSWSYIPGTALTSPYAGYFNGNVYVSGNLGYSGTLLTATPNPSEIHTESLSERSEETKGTAERLQTVDVQSYYHTISQKMELMALADSNFLGMDSMEIELKKKALAEMEDRKDIIGDQVFAKKHYALNTDQLEEVFPDLVYVNDDGTKSINYVEMVPVLVQAINELSAKIETLEGGNGDVMMARKVATGVDATAANVQILSLGQNKPNPFSTTTSVEVSVPSDVQSAFIYVYDLTGKKVQQVDITARGKQTVQLNAASLEEGMYLYSLIADGKVVQTRRMIVEK